MGPQGCCTDRMRTPRPLRSFPSHQQNWISCLGSEFISLEIRVISKEDSCVVTASRTVPDTHQAPHKHLPTKWMPFGEIQEGHTSGCREGVSPHGNNLVPCRNRVLTRHNHCYTSNHLLSTKPQDRAGIISNPISIGCPGKWTTADNFKDAETYDVLINKQSQPNKE